MFGDRSGTEVSEHDAAFGDDGLFRGTDDVEFLGIDLGEEDGGTIAGNVIVVGASAGVGEEESVAVGKPMLLGVIAAEVRAVVEGPGFDGGEMEAVVADGDVAFEIVTECEVEASVVFDEGGFADAAFDGNGDFIAVSFVDESFSVEATAHDGGGVVGMRGVIEVHGNEK